MAQQQRGGNDKQRSKSQSRSVAPTKRAPSKAGGRGSASKLTWGIVGVVLVVVLALVIYSLTSGNSGSTSGGNTYQAAPGSLVSQVSQIPASVYDTVGVTSSVAQVTPPVQVSGQPPLSYPTASGIEKPGVFYFGSEYCPFCATERWAVVAALSRFGPVQGLGLTSSSSTDVYPNTPSFSFVKASFSTNDIAVRAVENLSNIPDGKGSYTKLMTPTKEDLTLLSKYDTTTYFPSGQSGSIPFINIGNQFLVSGASFSPAILNGLTRDQIASNLKNPNNPATQAIIATANYLTASICKTTGAQPAAVCGSKGVQAAAQAMKISF
jgi:thiol-disulfide isomerase/thioredoxin